MQWLLEFIAIHKKYLILSVVVILSFIMMGLGVSERGRVAMSITTAILKSGQRVFSWVTEISNLRRENRFLRERNSMLSMALQNFRKAELENLRLRNLLEFKQRCQFSLLPAEVIARGSERLVNSITINAGSRDGIKKNMPVMTAEGLVGKVFRVFPTTSVVQLLLDRNCRVSAVIQNEQRLFGIVQWEEGQSLQLKNVPLRGNVKRGDIVVSSGMGGIFPKGLKIGTVSKVGGEKLGLFREVEVMPSARFSCLEEVFVLIKHQN